MPKTIAIDGIIGWEVSAYRVKRAMREAKGEDLHFEISSVGGSVIEAIEIHNAILSYAGNVTGTIVSIAASAAAHIASAIPNLKIFDNSIYMIHNPWSFAVGDYKDFQGIAEVLEGMAGILANGFKKKSKRAMGEIRSEMDEETWFFGKKIIDAGFANELIEAEPSEGETESDPIPESTALAMAKEKLQACYDMMRNDKEKLSEMQSQAMAFFNTIQKPAQTGEIKNERKEEKTMDKETLKKEHPDLYAAIYNDGISAERTRVKAHMHFLSEGIAIEHATNAIMEGNAMDAEQIAFYTKEGMKAMQLSARAADDTNSDDTGSDDNTGSDEVDPTLEKILSLSSVKPWVSPHVE